MVLIPWKITKRTVDALEPRAKPWTKFDSTIGGFGAEVRPSGLIVFVLLYRPAPEGRAAPQRRLVLGHMGEMTPDQARQAALDARAAIRQGRRHCARQFSCADKKYRRLPAAPSYPAAGLELPRYGRYGR